MKGTKTVIAIILGTLLIPGIACGGKNESPTPTPTPTLNEVNVDASFNGSETALAIGELLIVTLDSNKTTGYSWNLSAISNTSVIAKAGDAEYINPTPTDPLITGQGGQEVWTFEALAAGTANISMKYIRPWEQNPEPANTFDITVIVE
jgi:inhibitor of cysteine peptidase